MQYVMKGEDEVWRVAPGSGFDDLSILHPPSTEEILRMVIAKDQQVEAPTEGRPVVSRAVALVAEGEGWADV